MLDSRDGKVTTDGEFAEVGRLRGRRRDRTRRARPWRWFPATGVGSVVLNVTMIRPDGNGFVTSYPCGDRPLASSMNAPRGGGVVANELIAEVSAAGTVCLYSSVGRTCCRRGGLRAGGRRGHVAGSVGACSTPGTPVRTADGLFERRGRLDADDMVELDVLGRGGVPTSGVGAVVLNVTMIRPDSNGFVTTVSVRGSTAGLVAERSRASGGVAANELIAKVSRPGPCASTRAWPPTSPPMSPATSPLERRHHQRTLNFRRIVTLTVTIRRDLRKWVPGDTHSSTHSATRGGPSCRRRRTRGRSVAPGPTSRSTPSATATFW